MTENLKVNKTVVHVFKILDAISASSNPVGVSELTRVTELPKTTVFRLLETLEHINAVDIDANQQYKIGPRIFSYAKSVEQQNGIVKLATPYMKRFAQETKENINIGILYENQVLYLHSEEGEKFSLQVNLFPLAPLYCSSMGKIFLSSFSEDQLTSYMKNTKLTARTVNTLLDQKALLKDVLNIRKTHIAYDHEEYEYGLTCVAVPLIQKGKIIAAASVSGPTSRLKVRGWNNIQDSIVSFGDALNKIL